MNNLFSVESPIFQALNKITIVIWMNILWLISCIPIVTIGASTTAYFRMLFNIRQDKNATFSGFFRAFAANFKQSSALWFLQFVLAGIVTVLGWYTMTVESDLVRTALLIPMLVLLFVLALVLIYSAPLTAYFYNSVAGIIRTALAMGLRHYHQTIPALALALLPIGFLVLMPYWFLRLFPLVITFGTSGITYCIMLLMDRVFQNYVD